MSPVGREIFGLKYRNELLQETEWLKAGAGQKVDAIAQLLGRNRIAPRVMAELGSGVGVVIQECRRRELAGGYVAVDASPEAIAALVVASPGIDAQVADITDPGFCVPGHADLVVISHVLEHLEEPERCLANLRHSTDLEYAILEVPLEDLPVGRLKVAVLRNRRDTDAGHVQRYSRQSFELLINCAGFEIVDRCLYAPVVSRESLDLLARRRDWTRSRRWLKWTTMNCLPRALPNAYTRYYHAHYALLVRPRNRITPPGVDVEGREV